MSGGSGSLREGEEYPLVFHEVFPGLLQELQGELGLDDRTAATRAGMSVRLWNAYRRGEHFPEKSLPKIARGLGISLADFERSLIVRCAERLGVEIGHGRDLRREGEIEEEGFVFWRVCGRSLRRLHRELDVTQREAAQRAGVAEPDWSAYVRGRKAPKRNFPKLAVGLGMSPEELEKRLVGEALGHVGLAEGLAEDWIRLDVERKPGGKQDAWEPVYRRALQEVLSRRLIVHDISLVEAAERSGRSKAAWHRYVRGEAFPRALSAVAPGLGMSTRDLEKDLILASAKIVGLSYIGVGREERREERDDTCLLYWRAFREVLQEITRSLEATQRVCAQRAGLSQKSWSSYVRGRAAPAQNLPRIARGVGLPIEDLERRIVGRALEKLGFSASVRVLDPGPCWAFGGVLLNDGRLLLVDTFQAEVWEYSRQGAGRRVESIHPGVLSRPKLAQRSPGGALWMFGDGIFLEIDQDLKPRRSYAVWGRRDGSGRLLETICQWSLLDDETVVALTLGGAAMWVIRLILTSGEAGRFELLKSMDPAGPLERRFFAEGFPKMAVGDGQAYVMRLRDERTKVYHVGTGEVVESYPGGSRIMRETGRAVGDWFAGLGALGLAAVDDQVLVLRRHDSRYWLEDLSGRRWCTPRASNAMRVAPVVGKGIFGLLELVGESMAGQRREGLLWMSNVPPRRSGSR